MENKRKKERRKEGREQAKGEKREEDREGKKEGDCSKKGVREGRTREGERVFYLIFFCYSGIKYFPSSLVKGKRFQLVQRC